MLENSTYIPFDITGGVIVGDVASTSNYTLSGFTCDLTKFKFNIGNAVPSYISDDKFYYNIESIGNTVSSTIPIALTMAGKEGKIPKKEPILIMGFGVGYSLSGGIFIFD